MIVSYTLFTPQAIDMGKQNLPTTRNCSRFNLRQVGV